MSGSWTWCLTPPFQKKGGIYPKSHFQTQNLSNIQHPDMIGTMNEILIGSYRDPYNGLWKAPPKKQGCHNSQQ